MRILLVDGNNMMYRAHYANLDLQTRTGKPTGVLYGGLSMLLTAVRLARTKEIAFFFDGDPYNNGASERTFRAKMFKDYKAQRHKDEKATAAIWQQAAVLARLLRILKHKVYYVPGVEADDLIGLASSYLRKLDHVQRVVIYSGDTDYYQLIRGKVRLLKPDKLKGGVLYSRKTLAEFAGYDPVLAAHWKAIAGDTADNFKGVPGLGAKAATDVLRSGCDALTAFNELPQAVQRKCKTATNWNNAAACLRLSHICTEVGEPAFVGQAATVKAILTELESYERKFKNEDAQVEKFKKLCKQFELVSFISQRAEFFS